MEEIKNVLSVEDVKNHVYLIRGRQVMLDVDLADIYGYELKAMNQQVKRNKERFPSDFMFKLEKNEIPETFSKSQFVTLNNHGDKRGYNIKKLPYAFTEQGIYMLATVLKGKLAIQQSIFIMRAFKELQHYIRQNQQFVTQTEMELIGARVSNLSFRIDEIVDIQNKTDSSIKEIKKDIETLNENFITDKDIKNFLVYKNQKFEADVAYVSIYKKAKKSIYVVDNYINAKTLELLSQKRVGVEVIIFTENKRGKNGFLTSSLVNDFNREYPSLKIKPNTDSHDRWIIIDYNLENEQLYHCGASSKDAGSKLCAINKIDDSSLIHPVFDKLLVLPDKVI